MDTDPTVFIVDDDQGRGLGARSGFREDFGFEPVRFLRRDLKSLSNVGKFGKSFGGDRTGRRCLAEGLYACVELRLL